MQVRFIGRIVVMVGALVAAVGLVALKYETFGAGGSQTFWQVTTRGPVIVTVVAVAVTILAFVSFFSDAVILPALALGCCFWLFGQLFAVGYDNYHGLLAGFWVPSVAAFVASVGGVLALLGYRVGTPAGTVLRPVTLPGAAPGPPSPGQAPSAPPEGWYPDPSQPGQQRYWSGAAWTEQVQNPAPATEPGR